MHIRKRVVGALLGAVAVAVMAVPGAAQAAPGAVAHVAPNATEFVHIQSEGDGMCLQPTSSDANVPVIQTACHPRNAPSPDLQNWRLVQLGSGPTYEFVDQSGSECLWAFGNGDAGHPVGVEPCRNPPASNEQFNSGLTLPNSVFLEALIGFHHDGQCITVPPGAVDGTQMQILPCTPANVAVEGWNIF